MRRGPALPGPCRRDRDDEIPRDASASPDSGTPDVDPWRLPPCYRACDRVAACLVADCGGFEWSSVGGLYEECFTACDAALADEVLQAGDCIVVADRIRPHLVDLDTRCAANPCAAACTHLAGCIVDECPSVLPINLEGMVAGCLDDCRTEELNWVLDRTCPDLVRMMVENDPAFADACDAPVPTCAGPDLCEPYAARTAGCVVELCDGHADPYHEGLRQALLAYCLNDAACPSATVLESLLSPSLTCQSPAFKDLGTQPPFQTLCEDTVGATAQEVRDACEGLAACPGMEWMNGADLCMVYLAIRPDAAAQVACLGAAGDCAARNACLESAP